MTVAAYAVPPVMADNIDATAAAVARFIFRIDLFRFAIRHPP
ncbi:hypothetical protein TC41_0354 [Alicyclobacillus acidocaldarius subsp. acidocaldarius Tc-4-1]|uniref:Uncharacterized protein n=1 Tax=Alicyclobacillus acidocaldarius (strain Tc-4-1) TaxID=1048834 RepID=F8IKD2_ALIAT|nr:hypothetical protein TC41_0354 [Alicyclobacillus acidocaldarius subsp. acidocaldarius Tc-4-1]